MAIKTTGVLPVNSLGEIVAQRGTGGSTITGFISQDNIPTDTTTNAVVIAFPDLEADTLADTLTGFVSAAGTVAAADTILDAFEKLDGNQILSKATADAALPAVRGEQLLFVKRSANMAITTDQVLTKQFTGTQYRITDIVGVRKTGGASVACAGGIYDAASKGGNAIVANTQDWVSLAAGVMVTATKEALVNTTILTATPYISLTTGSTAACTADIFVYGYIID